MNARLYDSDIGRFLSADTIIQAPKDSQAYNRYTYVRNNPMMFTDPSGHSWFSKAWKKVKNWVKKNSKFIIATIAAVVTGGFLAPALLGAGGLGLTGAALAVGSGAAAGAVSGAITTGTLKGALKGALFGGISAGAAFGVAELTSSSFAGVNGHSASFLKNGITKATAFKSVAHGLARGAINKLQGGDFKGGFLSGLSSGFDVGTKGYGGIAGRTAIMAIVGGTASALGGGKFSNGAVSGAGVHLFNGEDVVSTMQSLGAYFGGDGSMVDLGAVTKKELQNSTPVINQTTALKNGTAKHINGNLSVNLTGETFHVGDTGVVFNTICSISTCETIYVGFVNSNIPGGSGITSLDSFSDPLGLGIEIWGGKPYFYKPHVWKETYPNQF